MSTRPIAAAARRRRVVVALRAMPEAYTGTNYCADIRVHPNGRFVYGTNRGHDSVLVAEISPETGTLRAV